jgi:hypothetical protein
MMQHLQLDFEDARLIFDYLRSTPSPTFEDFTIVLFPDIGAYKGLVLVVLELFDIREGCECGSCANEWYELMNVEQWRQFLLNASSFSMSNGTGAHGNSSCAELYWTDVVHEVIEEPHTIRKRMMSIHGDEIDNMSCHVTENKS